MGIPITHFEIGCKNTDKSKQFYSQLFDWDMERSGPTEMISTGHAAGIQGHINALGHEPHNYVTVYAEVDNIAAYLEKAVKLGGSVMIPETDIGDQGTFAWLKDIDGNIIGLWNPDKS